MSSIEELHQEANNLRKDKKFAEALPLYEKVWLATGDKYDGAGLLCCLRKLNNYDKAISFSKELTAKFPGFKWGCNEAIWTLISGKLNRLPDDASLADTLEVARDIMRLNPDELASKVVVFNVSKAAKNEMKWDIVREWIDKINPEQLSIEPMVDEKGKEGWCDQARWYNYKASSLIKTDKSEEVFQFIDHVIDSYPKQKKFFLRLKALALYKTNNLDEAEKCYEKLCSRQPDWWLLHEYAKVIKDKGHNNSALKLMCQAASSHRKLDTMVTLFKEIGLLCVELEKKEMARAHLSLVSLVRTENGWMIPEEITNIILEINLSLGNDNAPSTIKEALSVCRHDWEGILGTTNSIKTSQQRKPKRGLTGKVYLGSVERPYCFIIVNSKDSYFCFKSDLPEGIKEEDLVSFTALPSFDKKKKKESWKAVDIARCS